MDTNRLIDALVDDLEPVTPLPSVWRRVLVWLVISVPAVALVVAISGVRPDLAQRFAEQPFVNQELAMAATAIVGAWAALASVIPGTRRFVLWLPVVPLLGWMAAMGYQYWVDLARFGSEAMTLGIDLNCVPGIAAAGVVPMLGMVFMLRKGAGCNRAIAVFWGTLAAAALANAGLRLFHPIDAALMVIVWQFGTVLAFSILLTIARDRLVPMPAATPAAA